MTVGDIPIAGNDRKKSRIVNFDEPSNRAFENDPNETTGNRK